MKTRILTGLIAFALFFPVCWFSNYYEYNALSIIFPIAISVLCVIGTYEIIKCLGYHKKLALTIPMYIVAGVFPFIRHPLLISDNSQYLTYAIATAFAMLIYCLSYAMFKKGKEKFSDIMSLYGMFLYVVGCFSSIVIVRYSMAEEGNYMYLLIFFGAWVSDTSAYFVGRFLGKHKLIPEVSPKKTVEGAIGGVIVTLIVFVVYGIVVTSVSPFNSQTPIFQYIILGVVLPIISQIGDLVASLVKRQYNIKDYGKIFPGHGGVLDRFDSVLLVAPTLCIVNGIIGLII